MPNLAAQFAEQGSKPLLVNGQALASGGAPNVFSSALERGANESISAWFAKQDPFIKATLLTQGAGALGGATSGMFASMSASDRLELDQLMNEQRQAQVNRLNANNAFAPTVSFTSPSGPAGIMTRVRPA